MLNEQFLGTLNDAVNNLLLRGFDPNLTDKKRHTMLCIIISHHQQLDDQTPERFKLIIKTLIGDNKAILNQAQSGILPLNIAILAGNSSMVSVLLDCGANPNLKNENNHTPFAIALVSTIDIEEKKKIIYALHHHGAITYVNDNIIKKLPSYEQDAILSILKKLNAPTNLLQLQVTTINNPNHYSDLLLELKSFMIMFDATHAGNQNQFCRAMATHDFILTKFAGWLSLTPQEIVRKYPLKDILEIYSQMSVLAREQISTIGQDHYNTTKLLNGYIQDHNTIIDNLTLATDSYNDYHQKMIIYLINNLPFLESRAHLLDRLSKIMTPQQRADLLTLQFVVDGQNITLAPEKDGICAQINKLSYKEAQRRIIENKIKSWQPKISDDRDIDEILKDLDDKPSTSPTKKTAKTHEQSLPKPPKQKKTSQINVLSTKIVESPTAKTEPKIIPHQLTAEPKTPKLPTKNKGKKPPALTTSNLPPASITPAILPQISPEELVRQEMEAAKERCLEKLLNKQKNLHEAFQGLKSSEDGDVGKKVGMERVRQELATLREQIKKQEKDFNIFFNGSAAEQDLVGFRKGQENLCQQLSDSTADIREKLSILSPSRTGVSGSAVYQQILKSLPKKSHFSIGREPKDTDIFCVTKTAENGLFDENSIRKFIQDKFGSDYDFDLTKVNIFPFDAIPKQSISFKLQHLKTQQDFDINIYNQDHCEKLHQWQFGYDRLEMVWEGNEDGRLMINGSQEDGTDFCWQIYQDPEKFWQPNINASKFLHRLLGNQGCLEIPDLETLQSLKATIGNDKIHSDLQKYLEQMQKSNLNLSMPQIHQQFIASCQESPEKKRVFDSFGLQQIINQTTSRQPSAHTATQTNRPNRLLPPPQQALTNYM